MAATASTIRLLKETDPVTPDPTNQAITQMQTNLNRMQALINAMDVRGQLLYPDVVFADVYPVGTPVYIDVTTGLATSAIASYSTTAGNQVTPTVAAVVQGIVSRMDANKVGDICLVGRITSDLNISSILVDGETFAPGIYFLSGSDAGKVTKTPPTYAVPCFIALDETSAIVGSPYTASMLNALNFPAAAFVRTLAATAPLSASAATGNIILALAAPAIAAIDLTEIVPPVTAISGSPAPTPAAFKTTPIVSGLKLGGGLSAVGGTTFTAKQVAYLSGGLQLGLNVGQILNKMPATDTSMKGCSISVYEGGLSYYSMGGVGQLVLAFTIPNPTAETPDKTYAGMVIDFNMMAKTVLSGLTSISVSMLVLPCAADTKQSLPSAFGTPVVVTPAAEAMAVGDYRLQSAYCSGSIHPGDTVLIKIYRSDTDEDAPVIGLFNIVGGVYSPIA